MTPRVDLFSFDETSPVRAWDLGETLSAMPESYAVHQEIDYYLSNSSAEAILFWDTRLGAPDQNRIQQTLEKPGDVWHAGLKLGLAGLPGMIDFVSPTWMLNRDPDPSIEATSWRVSLRCCLVKTEVLRQIGFIRSEFSTLAGSALEWGHRCISLGALTRHIPWLVENSVDAIPPNLPFEDELRFLYYRFGSRWSNWAVFRAIWTGYDSPSTALAARKRIFTDPRPNDPKPYPRLPANYGGQVQTSNSTPHVSVLIPTLDRYTYLRTLLKQLKAQTVRPYEIIVVDQTPEPERCLTLIEDFPGLPLKVIHLKKTGQCSSRNAGLLIAEGDYVLFLDDDDEVPDDLIEAHLKTLEGLHSQVSCGVADEIGAGPLPGAFTYLRTSDVFPTNNALVQTDVFKRSGLFDMAYEHGSRADGDLGMRLYLTSAVMVLNPDIVVRHHHAPRGGLRTHKARRITYASSRQNLMHRRLPDVTEIYLAIRYFSPSQVRESLWLSTLGTFSIKGTFWRKVLKLLVSGILSPHSLWVINNRKNQAERLLEHYPKIPVFKPE